MTLYFCSSYSPVPSVGITGMSHYVWSIYGAGDQTQTSQVLGKQSTHCAISPTHDLAIVIPIFLMGDRQRGVNYVSREQQQLGSEEKN